MDNANIAKKALTAKMLPTCLFPSIINGKFRINKINETDKGVTKCKRRDTPVIPPSINEFGIRKLLRPKAAKKIPMIIDNVSFDNGKNSLTPFFI
jgi:hypothetical protein